MFELGDVGILGARRIQEVVVDSTNIPIKAVLTVAHGWTSEGATAPERTGAARIRQSEQFVRAASKLTVASVGCPGTNPVKNTATGSTPMVPMSRNVARFQSFTLPSPVPTRSVRPSAEKAALNAPPL